MAWIDAEPSAEIEATGVVPARQEAVFAFLADLENHWRLAGRFVEVVELSSSDGVRADGGVVRVKGPLGLRRTAVTSVAAARAPRLLIGTAAIGASTRARVSWSLAGHLDSTRVRLAAAIEHATPLDRVLLALGGRRWLRRRFETTLERLAESLGAGYDPAQASAVPAASSTQLSTDDQSTRSGVSVGWW